MLYLTSWPWMMSVATFCFLRSSFQKMKISEKGNNDEYLYCVRVENFRNGLHIPLSPCQGRHSETNTWYQIRQAFNGGNGAYSPELHLFEQRDGQKPTDKLLVAAAALLFLLLLRSIIFILVFILFLFLFLFLFLLLFFLRYSSCRYNERQLIDVTVVKRVRPRAERSCDTTTH